MLIEETLIFDSDFDASQASKLILADRIVEAFTPLFSEEIERKKNRLRESKQDHKRLKQVIKDAATTNEELRNEFEREKKIETILENSEVLLNHNVLYGKNKHVVSKILTSLGQMSMDELEKSTRLLTKLMRQNIKRVIT